MRKFIVILLLVVLGGTLAIKLNSIHYNKIADVRIEKVIDLQGAKINNAETKLDFYDSKNGYWHKTIYFDDDPEITYHYAYQRPTNEVRIFARYNNMSLDLANKKAKYPLYDVYFYKNGKVKELQER